MSVLNVIKRTLKEMCGNEYQMQDVYYGACTDSELNLWNYFVFNRKKTTKSSNRKDYQTFYEIHIVHEDYIPEGYIEKIVDQLENAEDCRLKCTADDIEYDYTFKKNTNMVVEIATITLFKPEKR